MRNAMNQLETYERESPVSDIAPWEKEEYAPYDVVWSPDVTVAADTPRRTTMGVYRSYEDGLAATRADKSVEIIHAVDPMTLYSAMEWARTHGRIAVVLRDHEENEIKRWPV